MTIKQFEQAKEIVEKLEYLKRQKSKIESLTPDRNYDKIQFNAVLTIDSNFISFGLIKNSSLKKINRKILQAEKELQEL